jgi:hypothetical protein
LYDVYEQAYAAGCNIVILASDFQRVQVIPSVQYGASADIQVSCISCCSTLGKVIKWYSILFLVDSQLKYIFMHFITYVLLFYLYAVNTVLSALLVL